MGEGPICDLIRAYRDGAFLRLHMPGHKGRGGTESLDVTEIRGLSPLYPASGAVLESEENAAALFGAGRTVYSAEGSSLCVRAMLALARMRAEREGIPPVILAGRNAHSSYHSGAALLGLKTVWLRGESLLTCRPSARELEAEMEKLSASPAAVYLTSPDYLGNRADIRSLSQVCRRRGVPLLTDNAHGAYLRFLPEDGHPLSLGADLVCDSAHKTLPVLTGGAYLHISRWADPLFARQAERAMSLFASTSPSWLILQSLDRCNGALGEGYRERLAAFAARTEALKARLREAGFPQEGDEPLKITLRTRPRGYTGDEFHERMRQAGIECEFSDPDFLVMMLTPETGEEGLERLERAVTAVPRRAALPEDRPAPPEPNPAMDPGEALTAPAERIPAGKSLGRILADPCVSCPPAVPIAVSGDRIGSQALRCFEYYGIREVSCVAARGGERRRGPEDPFPG